MVGQNLYGMSSISNPVRIISLKIRERKQDKVIKRPKPQSPKSDCETDFVLNSRHTGTHSRS